MSRDLKPALANQTVAVVGFFGVPEKLPRTKPLVVQVANQTHHHSFISSPNVPVNLRGRDLLFKMGASIMCSPDGLVMTCPDGTRINCSATQSSTHGQWLVRAVSEQRRMADIYWGLLQPETPERTGLYSFYLSWKPWLSLLQPHCLASGSPTCNAVL